MTAQECRPSVTSAETAEDHSAGGLKSDPIEPRADDNGVSRDTVPTALVDPDPDQPRRTFDPAALEELRASILANGLVSPILVRPNGDRYLIVAGERRWRSVCQLGWIDIPAEVRDLDDDNARWLQLVENLNRHDLSPIEEARAYKAMLDRGETQLTVAERSGKTRSYVASKLRLLALPEPLNMLLDRRAISEGHIKQLLRFKALYRPGHNLALDPDNLALDTVEAVDTARAMWADLPAGSEGRDAFTFEMIKAARPLDWPRGYPFDGKGRPLVSEATEVFHLHVVAAGQIIHWEKTAYWYAALTLTHDLSVADLAAHVNRWVEHVQTAALSVDLMGGPEPRGNPARACEWWGYRSDLRHAGLTNDHGHLTENAGERFISSNTGMALPSILQEGSPGRARYVELIMDEELPYARIGGVG